MKKIYIVFFASNFKSGRFIRFFTRGKYNHVAIAIKEKFTKVYSFARYNYYESFLGGFGVEYSNRYLDKGKDVGIKVCEYEVDEKHFERIVSKLEYYSERKTRYNFFSAVTYPVKKNVALPNAHTCISFVQELLEKDEYISINKLESKLSEAVLYEGSLAEYMEGHDRPVDDGFYDKRNKLKVFAKTCHYFAVMTMMLIRYSIFS